MVDGVSWWCAVIFVMQALETYNLVLCGIIFLALTALFTWLIVSLVKSTLRVINAGLDDEKIKTEYLAEQKSKKENAFWVGLNNALVILMCVILLCALCFSLYSRFTENSKVGVIPTVKAVETGSMETKHKNNTYLDKNNLNDQISTFDLVVLHQLPAEEDLQVYDIVVYETKGYFIIHRIVGIEEPNELHPNERWYVLRGDANERADEFPVTYSQMCSIYRGERIPFAGAFVMFMQSPAGMLCCLLVMFAVIALPIVEKKLQQAIDVRLDKMGLLGNTQAVVDQPVELAPVVATVAESNVDDEPIVDTVQQDQQGDEPINIFSNFGERKTFDERIELLSDEKKGWYNRLVYVLMQIPSIRQSRAKYHELYRQGNKPVAKIVVRGKSLYVYLPLDASNYQGRQFGFEDVSHVKTHGKLTSECKVTSERKLKNLLKLFAKYDDKIKIDLPVEGFDFYKLRKKLTLNQKLYRLPKERKARFKQIVKAMEQKEGATRWQSKNCITFKDGHKPLLKITVKGKSVCVYLAVDPSLYTAPKYGIKDVSSVKTYADYPAMCKVTSDRRLKYILQIINEKL